MRRALAALLCCFTVSGCGLALRPVAVPNAAPAAVQAAPVARKGPVPVFPPSGVLPVTSVPGQTVVTITFDDGRESNLTAAKILSKHGLFGTFYINSGNIGLHTWLTLEQLDEIAMAGHEIGGHTIKHTNLLTLSNDEIKRQVCDDRKALLAWGFHVTDFAYPFGSADDAVQQIIRDCGYNSARSLGELKAFHVPETATVDTNCSQCGVAEAIPPVNAMYTKAPAQVRSNWSLDDMKQQVGLAMSGGGGWLQLTFHGVCPGECTDITVQQDLFEQFVIWLADEQAQGHLIVRTVDDVMGGQMR